MTKRLPAQWTRLLGYQLSLSQRSLPYPQISAHMDTTTSYARTTLDSRRFSCTLPESHSMLLRRHFTKGPVVPQVCKNCRSSRRKSQQTLKFPRVLHTPQLASLVIKLLFHYCNSTVLIGHVKCFLRTPLQFLYRLLTS